MMARSRAGEWTLWRVGRHRLAWRPTRRAGLHAYDPYGLRADESAEMLSWAGALLATIVVLPWRIATNRWPVVAYVISPFDVEGQRRRTGPMPRAEAKALVRRWAAYIERYAEPPPLPDRRRPKPPPRPDGSRLKPPAWPDRNRSKPPTRPDVERSESPWRPDLHYGGDPRAEPPPPDDPPAA
ncbi:hypothetical protein HH310_16860 [Actinoplanes sp. TBRC 11911]|uniref:hypothetical protein n=1 Tax=Actinoplanes sp. TBRC 11911 TaxID=2729386 RepID=UPI00145E0C18|nr:hypothetical protein [Actinoplanes sp. TBRC 11911]NMO52855.1 hypothetical protein [Actinoplanes sp. TBRC 11911]